MKKLHIKDNSRCLSIKDNDIEVSPSITVNQLIKQLGWEPNTEQAIFCKECFYSKNGLNLIHKLIKTIKPHIIDSKTGKAFCQSSDTHIPGISNALLTYELYLFQEFYKEPSSKIYNYLCPDCLNSKLAGLWLLNNLQLDGGPLFNLKSLNKYESIFCYTMIKYDV